MKFLRCAPLFALVAVLLSDPVLAAAPDGPYGSSSHSAADMKWQYDGTRDALMAGLGRFLGHEKNIFGPVMEVQEGAIPPDSDYLADFVPHILGIPGPETRLPNGEYFYSGAEPHNASREVAMISRGRGAQVFALALLQENFDTPSAPMKALTVLVPAGRKVDPFIMDTFAGWARGEIEKRNASLQGASISKITDKFVVRTYFIGLKQ